MRRSRPLRSQIAITASVALLAVAGLLVAFSELRISWLSERFAREEARGNAALVARIRHAEAATLQRLNRDIASQSATTLVLTSGSDDAIAEATRQMIDLTDALTPKPAAVLLDTDGNVKVAIRIDDASAQDVALRAIAQLGEQRRFDMAMVRSPGTLSLVAVSEIRRGSRIAGLVASLTDFGAYLAEFSEDAAAVGFVPKDGVAVVLAGEQALLQEAGGDCCSNAPTVMPVEVDNRVFMAARIPIMDEHGNVIADLFSLREITEADAHDRRLTTLIYVLAGMTILLSIGLLMRAVRIALRPLGAVVRLLRRMSGGETTIAMQPFHSAREIETLANTVETFRDSLDAQKSLVALTEQLEAARRIQQSLLPQSFDLAPAKLDLYGAMRPAEDVGGDFFDTFRLDDGRIAVVVADVSGKGMGAALFAALASTALRSNARLLKDPVAIIRATNDELCLRNREDLFITVLFALVDPPSGQVEIVNAGHCPPFLAIAGEEPGVIESAGDLVLGVMPGVDYERRVITLDDGDTLLIYSDGFDEAQDHDANLLGMENARQAFARHRNDDAQAVVNGIFTEIDAFADGAMQADDITLFTVRRLEPAGTSR